MTTLFTPSDYRMDIRVTASSVVYWNDGHEASVEDHQLVKGGAA